MLREGRNCWRIARASRAAFIIDVEAYFRAVHEAIRHATRSIFLVGWDIHSEVALVRGPDEQDDVPSTLGALLDAVVRARPDLHVYIASWDFAMIYAIEREFFPRYKLQWKSHDRICFCLDGEHPVGASQHQKIVVVDDRLAFCGGIDLSQWRWDTREHRVDDDRRTDPSGKTYPPFHDVQVAVDGEAARAMSELVRERWSLASDLEPVALLPSDEDDRWPASVTNTLTDVDVAVARTLPEYQGRREVREVEQLYVDSIDKANRFIYVENQYLSSHRIGDALEARLEEPNGPDIILVMPEETGGWLEQHTMDVLRARLLRRLRKADEHGRLRVFFPRLSKDPRVGLMVHAKVMVIDDIFVRVGSSNLSNRSMGLDSECDAAIASTASRDCSEAIAGFRRDLLAEHLGVRVEAIEDAEGEHQSLAAAIDALRNDADRTLVPLRGEVPDEVDRLVPDSAILDPEKPVDPSDLFDVFSGALAPDSKRSGIFKVGAAALALLGLAALWRWTPLGDLLALDNLTEIGKWMDRQPFTPVLLLTAYVIAGLAVIPITLLFATTVLVFGPWMGTLYCLVGAELAALAGFGVGRFLGRDTVRRLAGSRVNRISRKLSSNGVMATTTLRVIPVAPFTIINVIAGVSGMRARDFALGSLIGVVPGVLAIAFLTDRIVAALREPDSTTMVTLVGAVVVVAAAIFGLRRWLR